MRTKSEIFNFELLVPGKVQLQKSVTVFQSRMISYVTLRQPSRIGKQYASMLEEYVIASFRSNYSSECYWRQLLDWANCRHSGQPVTNGKGASPSWLLDCCWILNNHRQTYRESGERAFKGNTTSQISVELLKCCRIFNTTRTTVLFGTNGTCCSSC